jgi:hypothetical protein
MGRSPLIQGLINSGSELQKVNALSEKLKQERSTLNDRQAKAKFNRTMTVSCLLAAT